MTRRLVALLTSLILALGALTALSFATAPSYGLADRDCGDFDNQAQAQDYFIDKGGPDSDPDGLDDDGDGIACESNPCPCSTNQGGGGGGGDGGGNNGPERKKQPAVVIKVIDGDTIDVRLRAGGKARVRMGGIDTPEVFGGKECGGPQASRALKKMLPRGTNVLLISDPSQDLTDRFERVKPYCAAQKAANKADRGLWGACR